MEASAASSSTATPPLLPFAIYGTARKPENSGRLKTQKPPYKGGLYSYFQTIA
nr:MAG TPA: hypothetical protein [Caudoviricetes sp.]